MALVDAQGARLWRPLVREGVRRVDVWLFSWLAHLQQQERESLERVQSPPAPSRGLSS